MADLSALAQGLAQGLNSYLGANQQQKRQQQNAAYSNELETQQKSQLQQQEAQLDTERQSMLAQQKNTMEDLLTPEMADKALPGLGALVTDYNKQRPGNPLKLEEGTKYLKTALDALDTGKNDQKEANRLQRFNNTALDFSQKMRNDYLLKKMNEKELALESSDALAELVQSGNTVAASGMGAQTARAMGEVGVLTATDVKNYITSKQLARGAADKLLLWIEGKPTDATLDEIRQINAVIKDRFDKKIRPITDDYVKRLAANTGMSEDEAAQRLNVPFGKTKQAKTDKNSDPLDLGI